MTWEAEHAAWRAAGNECGECERIERSLDGALPSRSWISRLLESLADPNRGERFQPPVLLGSALDPDGSAGLRDSDPPALDEPEPERSLIPSAYAPPVTAAQLRRVAENLEVKLQGTKNRGPTQSRAVWDAELLRLENDVAAAWSRWADAAFDEALYKERM